MADRSILLINPPLTKPCEPPAGMAKLAWALRAQGVDCRIYDASIDGILGLLHQPIAADDTWSRRALAGRAANLHALRSLDLYRNRDRYKRAVMDTNRVLHKAGLEFAGPQISMGNRRLALNSMSPSPCPTMDRQPFHPFAARIYCGRPNNSNPTRFIQFFLQSCWIFSINGNLRSSACRSIS